MIGHLRLVSSGQQDFKVCDWPLRLVSNSQSQTLKSTRPSSIFEPGLNGRRPPETGGHWELLQRLF